MPVISSRPLTGTQVLVVEDEFFIAYDIAQSIEEAGGRVAGPVATLEQARELLHDESLEISGVILDMNLRDGRAEGLARELHDRDLPVVVNTAEPLPLPFQATMPDIPVFSKPTLPQMLTDALYSRMHAA
ncbi:response regulator [Thioclava atlantica]|uniref:Response regulator receiver protein n=1 Tax=Thioclava atlantica TaxID=1317124 RepID=A0A085TTA5_9RHOB|nr:response regulator [Thioclava atlantica]KFE33952.1 response regulator receiver protein [Thioclava atlantica]